jgi:hypothetical protein
MVLQALDLEPRVALLRDRAAALSPAQFAAEWRRLLTEVQHCL